MNTTLPKELPTERGVAQYHRLANLLRHEIASGVRPIGSQLPPLAKLAQDMGIATVTARHAYALLASEGLIRSQRGRGTHVVKLPARVDNDLIVAANNSVLEDSDLLQFKVLDIACGCAIPADVCEDQTAGDTFTRIRKVQVLQELPFSYTILYLPTSDFVKMPQDIVNRQKILGVLLDIYKHRKCTIRQRTTIGLADQALSELLECPLAYPVAKIVRTLTGPHGQIIYAGTSWYRSDRFVSDVEYPASLLSKVPAMTEAKTA